MKNNTAHSAKLVDNFFRFKYVSINTVYLIVYVHSDIYLHIRLYIIGWNGNLLGSDSSNSNCSFALYCC